MTRGARSTGNAGWGPATDAPMRPILVIAVASLLTPHMVRAQVTCSTPERIGRLAPQLVEASGITRDPVNAEVLWLHNDSGHQPSLYAVDLSGQLIGVAPLEGVSAMDLEDIAIGQCDTGWCFYLGDIGDNVGIRPGITVHRLPVPVLPAAGAALELPPIEAVATFVLRYPDGARDAESLVIDDERGEILILSKGRSGEVGLYSASLPASADTGNARVLTFRGILPIPTKQGISHQATAADLKPDGSLLAVRTYVTLYLFEWEGAEAFNPDMEPHAESLRSIDEPQGEGVTFALEEGRLYLASEGQRTNPPLLSEIRCTPQ